MHIQRILYNSNFTLFDNDVDISNKACTLITVLSDHMKNIRMYKLVMIIGRVYNLYTPYETMMNT